LTLLTLVAIGFFLFLVRKHEIFTYVPLGPVLVLGSLIMVFWGKPVLDVLGKVLSPV
jgi:prepilin signal peptidase PulO-like enzyme (type II secretory pathway)